MSFFEQDFSEINESQAELILPPTIQWWQGDGKSKGVLGKGGFELPMDRYQLPDFPLIDFTHEGEVKPGYGFETLHLAILASTKIWYVKNTKPPQRQYNYDPDKKGYSVTRLWAFVKELEGEYLISVSSTTSQAVENAIQVFKKSVIKAASDKAGVQFPLYAFFLPITAGPVKKWSKGSYTTPPQMALETITEQTFAELYVGDWLKRCEASYEVAQQWAEKMMEKPAEETASNGSYGPTEPPSVFEDGDEFPF